MTDYDIENLRIAMECREHKMNDINNEIWKDIPDYEGFYKVSNIGNIKSLSRIKNGGKFGNSPIFLKERILKPGKGYAGHLIVGLYKNGKYVTKLIHRLVASVFIANPEKLNTIHHINHNPADNRVENLKWVTIKDNVNYTRLNQIKNGEIFIAKKSEENINAGEKQGLHKLTEKNVLLIRELWETNKYTQKELGKRFGVHAKTISKIILRRRWNHI